MRIRHKIPSIFSLSMVDMLCCALGCVILVWLLNAKQSEDEAEERRAEVDTIMSRAQAEREESTRLLSDARQEHARATERVRTLTKERDDAIDDIRDLKNRLSVMGTALARVETQLSQEQKQARDLAGKLKQSSERITSLDADLRTGMTRLDDERKKVANLARQLGERDDTLKNARADLARRETSIKSMQADLLAAQERNRQDRDRTTKLTRSIESTQREQARLEGLLKESRLAKDKVESTLAERDKALEAAARRESALDNQLKQRQAALDSADARMARLEKDKRDLQSIAEARFAGIELSGERVIFLIDSSGSMEMLDDKTEAPKKWIEVRQTVAKLMRSLPRLQKYQLVTFGPKYTFPLGSEGKWLDYDPKTSPDQVLKTLTAIKPSGGTNMYIAFDAAFRYRAMGLDTIYLLSDGLPNQGEGLTTAQSKTLTGINRGVVLGKHVRTMLSTTWNKPLAARSRVKIHTIGYFYESPDLGSFLWALARENDGSFVGMSKP
jgi:predicted  nucleic acid-binding Zn-ribbon protein